MVTEYKMCPNEEMAAYILEFIKRNYEKHSDQAGVQKYIEALQMGIDALQHPVKVEESPSQQALVKQLTDELGTRMKERKVMLDTIKSQKAEIERLEKGELSKAMTFNSETIKRCVAEANKDFAKKLRALFAEFDKYDSLHVYEIIDRIDIVEEEMEGADNGTIQD